MIVVGIDPGQNTGLAVWDTVSRSFLDIRCSGIVDAMRYLNELQATRQIGLLVFEDARKRKWLPREKSLKEFKGRAMGAGSVRRDSAIWEEYCRTYAVPFVMVAPRPTYFQGLTGYDRRTNEHGRDAAMLVFGR